jgi:hypothetical protein
MHSLTLLACAFFVWDKLGVDVVATMANTEVIARMKKRMFSLP